MATFLVGCGVESVSTSDSNNPSTSVEKISFSGTVRYSNGSPAAQISVINATIGDSTITDSSGSYSLSPAVASPLYEFILENDSFSIRTTVNLDEALHGESVTLNFSILEDKSSANAEVVQTQTDNPSPQTPSDGPFDKDGNTKSFGIPEGMSGNAHAGKKIYFSKCAGCHPSIVGKHSSYQTLTGWLRKTPMDSLGIKPQQTADLVAYLNFIH